MGDYAFSGSATLSFYVINQREDFVFYLISGNWSGEAATIDAMSNVVTFTNPEAPKGGHLYFNGNPDQMVVTWTSKGSVSPQVKYGTQSGNYPYSVTATSATFTQNQMCGSPAQDYGWRDPGQVQTAVMTNLSPSTVYYYVFGDQNSGGFSKEFSFTSAPPAGFSNTMVFAAYADMGKGTVDNSILNGDQQQWSLNTTAGVQGTISNVDLIFHVGDISYADGYLAQWDMFLDQIEPIATAAPYITCAGNHDYDWDNKYMNALDSGGECGVPYYTYFANPKWYSFNWGNVHFVVMSTEDDFTVGSEQNNWLASDLSSVDRSVTNWIVFQGHRPMYLDVKDGNKNLPVAELLQQHIEPLFAKYQVDLALWGHHHTYMRTCAVYQQECVTGGTTHVLIGMAGAKLSKSINSVTPEWLVYEEMDHGYTMIQVSGNSLTMSYYTTKDMNVADTFTLSPNVPLAL
jgi:predicted phosphodiesterase